ncbi:MAG: hypothetical protein LBI68_08935 [Azoarcus sp.]|jgi:hypothetical protein|nr:hypothetical protein [Azoarcus sp.]
MTDTDPSLHPAPEQPQHGGEHHHRSTGRSMKIRRVPMRNGWYWLIEGFALWLRNPAFLSFITFGSLIVLFAALFIPYIGELIGMMLVPCLTLSIYNGCRAIDRRRRLGPELLLSGFRRHTLDLIVAGFCNFIVVKTVLESSKLIDGGAWLQLLEYAEEPDMMTLTSPHFLYAFIMMMALLIPWGIAYLFVPQIIGWWRQPVIHALSSSFIGCLRNWLPLLVYMLCYAFFVCMLSALVINFFNLVKEGLGTLACTVFILAMFPILLGSFYVAARDIFGLPRRRRHRHHPTHPHKPQAQETEATPRPGAQSVTAPAPRRRLH